MAYELNEGQGSLFKNDKREKDTHPNLQGSIMIDGRAYWLSGWTKEGAKGKWISLQAKPKEARPNQAPSGPAPATAARRPAPAPAAQSSYDDPFSDEVPF